MRLRRRLLNKQRESGDNTLKQRIKNLNMEIKAFYTTKQRQKVRKNIIPGNTKSLWRAVNEAKNLNNQELPEVMYHGDVELDWLNLSLDTYKVKCKTLFLTN